MILFMEKQLKTYESNSLLDRVGNRTYQRDLDFLGAWQKKVYRLCAWQKKANRS